MGGFVLILLDTHFWIWFHAAPGRIPLSVLETVQSGEVELAISAISVWETAIAVQIGRLNSPMSAEETVRKWIGASPIQIVSVDSEIAILSRSLRFEHDDPADRFIAATAFRLGCPLATVDERLRKLKWLKVLPSRD